MASDEDTQAIIDADAAIDAIQAAVYRMKRELVRTRIAASAGETTELGPDFVAQIDRVRNAAQALVGIYAHFNPSERVA